VIFLDHRQRQVDAGRNAGRSPDVSVAHEDAIVFDAALRIRPAQLLARRPMRDGGAAIEHASARQDEGTGADAEQKAEADGVVRRSLIVTPRAERGTVRVLVSMDIEGTRSFGVFSIPIHLER
jgi:hypothetical protein